MQRPPGQLNRQVAPSRQSIRQEPPAHPKSHVAFSAQIMSQAPPAHVLWQIDVP
jgi:hypothetical protein